jgi:hypothetical protein
MISASLCLPMISEIVTLKVILAFKVISIETILSDRVAAIFSLPNSILLIVVTAIVGGLAGGFGGLSGSLFRNWIMPQPN